MGSYLVKGVWWSFKYHIPLKEIVFIFESNWTANLVVLVQFYDLNCLFNLITFELLSEDLNWEIFRRINHVLIIIEVSIE